AFFEQAATGYAHPKAIANWVINNLPAQLAASGSTVADLHFTPAQLRDLAAMVESGRISSKIAQDVFADMFATGEAPAAIVERKGLAQVSDTSAIEAFCDQAIAANPGPAADFKAGKDAALNFLKGQVMKLSKGKANPGLVGDVLARKLRS
ncbi:MAG: Asp-tRNA(Asn)/Glu-tRNA(Gln) amidotransferase GatCAB subunit B, partial [Verrucomicrobiota bacterium]